MNRFGLSTRFFLTAVTALCGFMLAIGTLSSDTYRRSPRSPQKPSQQDVTEALKSGKVQVENLSIRNRTQSFALLSAELSPDREGVSLRLQNRYKKSITAFQLSFGIVKLERELIYEESKWVKPNQIITFENEAELELDTRGIEILAVLFDDGTSDGARSAIRDIREYRVGIKMAIKEVLPRLETSLSSNKQTSAAEIDRFSSEISTLPKVAESSLPAKTKQGIHDQRWRIVEELKMLREDSLPTHTSLSIEKKQELQHAGLSTIVEAYRRIIAVP